MVGDINLHVSDATNNSSLRFLTLLDSFNLSVHFGQPIRADNQLDIFVCRSDQLAPVARVDPPLLSDHSLIVGLFELIDSRAAEKSTVKRRPFDYEAFTIDLEDSTLILNLPTDITELFASYDATLIRLLDKHARLRIVKVKARPAALWFDVECHDAKTKTRNLEKVHRRKPTTETRTAWKIQ
jgi:hypothetical protein